MPSPRSPHGSSHGSSSSLVSADGASANGSHVTFPTPALSPHHHSNGVDGKLEKEVIYR